MEVFQISRTLPIGRERYLISTDKRAVNFISLTNFNTTIQPPETATVSAKEPLAAAGGAGKGWKVLYDAGKDVVAVNTTSDLLLTQLNNVTAPQLAGVLQQYHLVSDQSLSLHYSTQVITSLQTNGVHAALIGVKAGAITFTAVDRFRPEWPLSLKLALTTIVSLAVGLLVYFSAPAKQPPDSSPPAAIEAK